MGRHVMCVKVTAQPGQREELLEHVLAGAYLAESFPGCEQFAVNASTTEPDVLWTYSVFVSPEAAQEMVSSESLQATIVGATPLIADRQAHVLELVGGKNVPGF
jgi:quinol monooxygenase YgiN